ncbi:hypothetical protein [Streptosporangium sp. NPDC023615]|uniref:hypothetical protein n=1 Tax=Streptosporangium sp. NPDC023615 TaxID=3154794 RepID=UPI00341BF4CB
MRRLLPVLAVCALTGCGSPDAGPQAAPSSHTPGTPATSTTSTTSPEAPAVSPTATPSPPSSPSPSPSRKPTTRVKDCFDGDCLLKLSEPVTIRLNAKKFHYPRFKVVAVKANTITYWVEHANGGGAWQTLGEGGSSSFSFRERTPVEVSLVSIKKGRALLSISPGKRG